MQLRESGEDYLEAILAIRRSCGAVRAIDIATRLGVTKASVSKALAQLESKGFVEVVKRDVRLTDDGLRVANEIIGRHEFFYRLLVSAGVEDSVAAEEACHMEHCLSEDSFQKLKSMLNGTVSQD